MKFSKGINIFSIIDFISILGHADTMEYLLLVAKLSSLSGPFFSYSVSASINNIKALNFFESVKGEILDGNKYNSKIININIVEKATGEIFAGVGTGTNGSNLSFGIKENNYLGKGV